MLPSVVQELLGLDSGPTDARKRTDHCRLFFGWRIGINDVPECGVFAVDGHDCELRRFAGFARRLGSFMFHG